jgi:rubrerythrin
MDMSDGMDSMNYTNNMGNMANNMKMPEDNLLDEETRQFMSEGYIMGSDCFGNSSNQYADRLMEFINDEYSDHLYYLMLARRSPTAYARRLFNGIAADELRHSKRYAAAYFLITGKRYFPTRNSIEPVVVPPSYIQALRQRYLAESRDAVKYRMFAQQTRDRCLTRIALATSEDEKRHAQNIMELIQSM